MRQSFCWQARHSEKKGREREKEKAGPQLQARRNGSRDPDTGTQGQSPTARTSIRRARAIFLPLWTSGEKMDFGELPSGGISGRRHYVQIRGEP